VTQTAPPSATTAPVVTAAPAQRVAPQPAPAQAADEEMSVAANTPSRPASAGDDIVVPGQVERQVLPPQGDPRSNEERRADVRAWDQCVMQVQNAFDADPMRPQLTTPEEYCRQSLGMVDRSAIPISRQQQRRR
jgi:hypothetical protein